VSSLSMNEVSTPCSSSISWDGQLCEGCRTFFDTHLSTRTHTHTTLHIENPRSGLPWTHHKPNLSRCATLGCAFCALVWSNFVDEGSDWTNIFALRTWEMRHQIMLATRTGMNKTYISSLWRPGIFLSIKTSMIDLYYSVLSRCKVSI
jgi:hypothetical protein